MFLERKDTQSSPKLTSGQRVGHANLEAGRSTPHLQIHGASSELLKTSIDIWLVFKRQCFSEKHKLLIKTCAQILEFSISLKFIYFLRNG